MLKPLSWLKSFTIIGILALSLLLNGALLLFDGVYTAAVGAISALSGVRSVIVQQADEIADLNSQLIVERQTSRELRSEISEMTIARRQAREMISDTAGRVGTRMQRGAGRSIASMPGQALPYVGATIVVAATAVEVADMCATMVDMVELQKLFDPDFVENEDQLTVCGLDVPDRQEIIMAIKEAPEEVWNTAVEAFPNREDIQNMEFPDVDWSGMAERAISSSQDMAESAMTSASGKWGDIKTWWNAE